MAATEEHMKKKIYDCVIYSGEIQMLRARLLYLNEICDYFVIVEGTKTFSGLPRSLENEGKKELIDLYGERIRWVIFDADNLQMTSWEREAEQREAIKQGLHDAETDDVVIVSDVDEIPDRQFLRDISIGINRTYVFKMDLRRYDIHLSSTQVWPGTVVFPWVDSSISIQGQRMKAVNWWLNPEVLIVDGGWHFSTLGGVFKFRDKLKSFSHTEFNIPIYLNFIYLTLLVNFGISIDGSELHTWTNKNQLPLEFSSLCTRNHHFLWVRVRTARCLQPIVRRIFLSQVGQLSSPERPHPSNG